MPTYRLLDAAGNMLATADDPTDLFDVPSLDDDDERDARQVMEIACAVADVIDTGEALIGDGAAPLFVLERCDD